MCVVLAAAPPTTTRRPSETKKRGDETVRSGTGEEKTFADVDETTCEKHRRHVSVRIPVSGAVSVVHRTAAFYAHLDGGLRGDDDDVCQCPGRVRFVFNIAGGVRTEIFRMTDRRQTFSRFSTALRGYNDIDTTAWKRFGFERLSSYRLSLSFPPFFSSPPSPPYSSSISNNRLTSPSAFSSRSTFYVFYLHLIRRVRGGDTTCTPKKNTDETGQTRRAARLFVYVYVVIMYAMRRV